jgi:hypothetical protein
MQSCHVPNSLASAKLRFVYDLKDTTRRIKFNTTIPKHRDELNMHPSCKSSTRTCVIVVFTYIHLTALMSNVKPRNLATKWRTPKTTK